MVIAAIQNGIDEPQWWNRIDAVIPNELRSDVQKILSNAPSTLHGRTLGRYVTLHVAAIGWTKTSKGWSKTGPNIVDKINIVPAVRQPDGRYYIESLEIFYPNAVKGGKDKNGKETSVPITEDDIDEIIANTNRIIQEGGAEPGITLGHPARLVNPETAEGRARNFRRLPDGRMYCSAMVTWKALRMLERGDVQGVSIGIGGDAGLTSKRVAHVALLGGESPALPYLRKTEVYIHGPEDWDTSFDYAADQQPGDSEHVIVFSSQEISMPTPNNAMNFNGTFSARFRALAAAHEKAAVNEPGAREELASQWSRFNAEISRFSEELSRIDGGVSGKEHDHAKHSGKEHEYAAYCGHCAEHVKKSGHHSEHRHEHESQGRKEHEHHLHAGKEHEHAEYCGHCAEHVKKSGHHSEDEREHDSHGRKEHAGKEHEHDESHGKHSIAASFASNLYDNPYLEDRSRSQFTSVSRGDVESVVSPNDGVGPDGVGGDVSKLRPARDKKGGNGSLIKGYVPEDAHGRFSQDGPAMREIRRLRADLAVREFAAYMDEAAAEGRKFDPALMMNIVKGSASLSEGIKYATSIIQGIPPATNYSADKVPVNDQATDAMGKLQFAGSRNVPTKKGDAPVSRDGNLPLHSIFQDGAEIELKNHQRVRFTGDNKKDMEALKLSGAIQPGSYMRFSNDFIENMIPKAHEAYEMIESVFGGNSGSQF